MTIPAPRPIPEGQANDWLDQIFSAKAAQKGGVVRRSRNWIAEQVGEEVFIGEVRRRGFHLLECGPQWVVVCADHPIRRIV